jgi:hypothetical protein
MKTMNKGTLMALAVIVFPFVVNVVLENKREQDIDEM